MLRIYDKSHNAIGHIVKYKDCKIESDVATGDKTLSFTYLAKHHSLENEMYIRTKDDEYVVKELSENSDSFPEIVAALNLEDLEKDIWQTFSVQDVTIDEAARMVLAGTGWTIGECDVTKRRNAGMLQVSSLDVIKNLCTAFMCEPVFDTINKTVSFYSQRGEDKGVYFLNGLNLKKIQKKSSSYDFYTRIIPIGADGLTIASVNDGKEYLDNHQYSDKVLAYTWKDESYTDAQALMEDAELKLNDLSKPEISYSADIRDLSKQKPEYSILSFALGDTVTLIDRGTETREKQRIKKLTEYPQDPNKNTCEIANTVLTFEELQEKYQAAAAIVNYTISNDGKIKVSDILHFESGVAGSNTVAGINSSITSIYGDIADVKLTIGQIETNYLKAETADLNYATIDLANITSGSIKNAMIDIGAVQTAQIADGAITDAKIVDLTANKITAGTLSVERLEIRGSTNSIVYALNNITGALQAQNVDTLNGEILTPRSITADRIVANSITGNEIAAKTITANNIVANSITGDEIAAGSIKAVNIDVTNLFAQDIKANGKIRGATLIGASVQTSGYTDNSMIMVKGVLKASGYYTESGLRYKTETELEYMSLNFKVYDPDDNLYKELDLSADHISLANSSGTVLLASTYDNSLTVWGTIDGQSITEGGTLLSDKYAALSHTHSYLPLAGGTMTGNLSVPSVYTSSWFRSTGDTGWYNETYGGGIYMDNDEYVKVYNGKNFHCDALISTGSEFRSVRSGYDYDWRFGAGCGTGDGAKFGFYNNQQGLVASFDPSKFNVLNKEIVSDNPNGICQFRAVNGNYGFMIRNDGTKTYFLVTDSGNAYGFWTTSFIPFSIDNQTGEVTIGTDAVFNSEIRSNGNINAKTVSTYSGTHKPLGSIDTDGQRVSGFGGSSTTVLKAYSQWGTAGASYSAKNIAVSSSDIRLKRNILDTNVNALDMINSIKVRQFDWIDNPRHQPIGFVADELEELDPLFSLGGGYDEDGNMDVKSVDTFYMMGYVVKGMQEICAIDAEQDIRLAELDRKYLSHDTQIESLQQQLIDARQQIAEQSAEIAQLRGMIGAA